MDRLDKLVKNLESFPQFGSKSSIKFAYYLLNNKDKAMSLAKDIEETLENIHRCKICCNYSEADVCGIFSDDERDHSTILVVEKEENVMRLDKEGGYNGLYHVLGGTINMLEGIGPDEINMAELFQRIDGSVKEVIIATDPDVAGAVTANYIKENIPDKSVKVTRIGTGVPMGADLSYYDAETIRKAIDNRVDM